VVALRPVDVQKVFEIYEELSHESGLYLNTYKTEILNEHEKFEIHVHKKTMAYTVKSTKICGKAFSNDPECERLKNIGKLIEKAKQEIAKWNSRKLITCGRIIIFKTFGLTQVIHQIQNTFYEISDLKDIEKAVYKSILNGPDKIKRKIMQEDYNRGGLKCPNIEALDKTLKMKQILRSSKSNTAQGLKLNGSQPRHK
jgi:hypothetical protein